MDSTSLVYFITLCNLQNFTKASETLHISQSALSRRVMMLEDEFGATFIDRSQNRFELTKAGETFLNYAKRMVNSERDLHRRIDMLTSRESLAIAFSQSTPLRPLMDVASQIHELQPDLSLYFNEGSLKSNVGDFMNDEADILYTTRGELFTDDRLETITLLENHVAALVPKGHRLWNHYSIDPGELEQERFLVLNSNLTGSKTVTSVVEGNEDAFGSNVFYCKSFAEMMVSVAVTGGVGLAGIYSSEIVNEFPDKFKLIKMKDIDNDVGDLIIAYKKKNLYVKDILERVFWKNA